MALPLINVLGSAALTAATPFLSKALQGLMGGSEAERERERALAETERVAQGGTTQGQAGMAYARSRALQDLAQQAQRGTAQQQAGLARDAMTAGADVQARYASQLAELRSREQERAREAAAFLRNQKAREDALIARQTASKFAEGALTPLVQQLVTPGVEAPPSALPPGGISSEEAAASLGFTSAPTQAPAVAGPAVASVLQGTREPSVQPGYESLYTGPATTVAPSATQQKIEQDAAMTYMAMRDPSKTAMAREYFAPGPSPEAAAATNERLRAERNLATANVIPGPVAPGQKDYTAGMSGTQGTFATLADREAANAAMSPFMKSPMEQGASASLAPTNTPMAFSYNAEQTEGLRKARPGRMPRKPGQTVRGGGGYAL